MSKKTGGPAFPIPGLQQDEDFNGMSLRDYFAAKAMHAAARHPEMAESFTFGQRATWAYQQADAMLAAREQRPVSDPLVVALQDCVSVMDRELNGLAVIQPELRQAREALAAAGAA